MLTSVASADAERLAHDAARCAGLLVARHGQLVDVLGVRLSPRCMQARHGRDGGGRGVLFEAAAVAAAARVAVGDHRDVAQFAGHAEIAVQDAAAGDDAAADAGAEREQHQVVHVAAGAHPLLAERRGVGVVLQDHAGAAAALPFRRGSASLSRNGRLLEFVMTPSLSRMKPGTPTPMPARPPAPQLRLSAC